MDLKAIDLLALQISILLTVFAFGLLTSAADLTRVFQRPAFIVRALLAMFVVMPVLAVVLARTFELRPAVEIALVALALSPVPPILPAKQTKAGVQADLSIGLLALLAILSVAFVPLGVELVGRYFGRPFAMSPGAIARTAGVSVVLPLVVGMAVRAMAPGLAGRIAQPIAHAARLILAVAILVLLEGTLPAIWSLIGNGTVLAIVAFAATGLAVGHWLGGPQAGDRILVALSTSSRHPAIALGIAKANFPDEPFLGAAILLYLVIGGLVAIPYLKRARVPASDPMRA